MYAVDYVRMNGFGYALSAYDDDDPPNPGQTAADCGAGEHYDPTTQSCFSCEPGWVYVPGANSCSLPGGGGGGGGGTSPPRTSPGSSAPSTQKASLFGGGATPWILGGIAVVALVAAAHHHKTASAKKHH